MKKVTIKVDGMTGESDRRAANEALNGLSGVVAAGDGADFDEIDAYAGERLANKVMTDAVKSAGFPAYVIGEDYVYSPDNMFENNFF